MVSPAGLYLLLALMIRPCSFTETSHLNSRIMHLSAIISKNNTRPFSMHYVRPAIEVALEKVKTSVLMSQVEIVAHFQDSACSSRVAPIAAFEAYRQKKVNVFFGPVSDYSLAPVARYASYLNIPIVTPGGMVFDFAAKTSPTAEYKTLSRVGATSVRLAEHMMSILKDNNWKELKMIVDAECQQEVMPKLCFLLSSGVVYWFRRAGIKPVEHVWKTGMETPDYILTEIIGVQHSG